MATASVPYPDFVNGTTADGDQVDANFSSLVTFLNGSVAHLDGSKTMTGALTLSGDPTSGLHATTKQYVDARAAAVTAKGQITAATGSGAVAALAASSVNGYLLLADSNQTTGLRYSGPASEAINIVASAATGTINMNLDTAPIWYYTTNASANHTLNVRYSATVSLNTYMSTGSSLTCVWLNTNGATAYWPSTFQIDGTNVTPKWQGGSAPSGGNASAIDAYTYTIVKTASATFTVLAAQAKFA